MGIVGFNYTKFDCQRDITAKQEKSIEVKHNIAIKNVEVTSLNLGAQKSDVLRVTFGFDVLYSSKLGKIAVEGDLLYTDTKEIIDESFKSWKSDKKMPDSINLQVYNFIFDKVLAKAIDLCEDLNLPWPIPKPKVNVSKK